MGDPFRIKGDSAAFCAHKSRNGCLGFFKGFTTIACSSDFSWFKRHNLFERFRKIIKTTKLFQKLTRYALVVFSCIAVFWGSTSFLCLFCV